MLILRRRHLATGPMTAGVAMLLALCPPLIAGDSFPINVYPCPKAVTATVMDRKLDDAAWKRAPLVSGFTYFGKKSLVPVQTSFRVLWNEKNLYLGIRCDEPEIDKLNPIRYAHDEHAVFSNETVEFFVDPNHTHRVYYQLAFNVAGSLYDGEREDTVWNSDAEVKTHAADTFWSAEIAVPWGPLKAKPVPGKVVGFNVNRDRNIGKKTWSTWARVQRGFHDPERFAHLVLSGTPESIGKLSREFRKGGRTGPITVFSAEGFAQTSYTKLAEAAFVEVEKLLADLEAMRRKDKESGVAAEIKLRLDKFQRELASLKKQSMGKLDAATWTRLDIKVQALVGQLRKTVAEARLTALLNTI
ncbi:MAG: carbohydrate-binding family 9-like protein [Kiritimatiellia bacterium]|nr:carbohydrate-binding family 9-like protein [Kiritimatiellia bacterium]